MNFDKIRALNDRQKSREKLPIFYGSRDNFMHGFREVAINNTIDEISNNFESGTIDIILHDDNETITVRDTGRGMPIAGESDGIPNWQMFFTILFASGKYDIEDGVNTGTNGVGATILNFTSQVYNVRSYHNGEEYIIEFENGGYIKTPLTYIGKTDKHGTEITFKLDKECYTETRYNPTDLINLISRVSGVSPKTTINFTYKGEITSFHFDNIEDYFKSTISEDYFLCPSKVYNEDGEITEIQVVLYPTADVIQEAFLNRNFLAEGGTINKGLANGVRLFVNRFLKDQGMYSKNEKAISTEDVENTISFVANVLSSNVEFQSQTKFSTQKKLYGKLIQDYIQEYLHIFAIERKDEFKKFANQILINKRVNEKAESIRKDIKKKLSEKISITSKVEGLIECKSKDITKRRILICEGKSALSGLIDGRTEYQALFPLRGKVLNCFKASDEQIFKNDVIINLFRALNCGIEYGKKSAKKDIGGDFNLDNLRYQGVDIVVDSDVDGVGSICPLILAMFYKLAPTLIQEGRIRLILTPLYEIVCGSDDYYYAVDDEELEKIENKLKGKKYSVHYVKGIGELSKHTMKYCLQEDYKRVYTFTMDDYEESLEKLEIFMGKDIEKRKEYILKEY